MKKSSSLIFTVIIVSTFSSSFFSSSVYAADFGIGASLKTNSSVIYFPVDITDNFRLEPFFSTQKNTSRQTSGYSQEYKDNEYGVGLFGVTHPTTNTNFIFGSRFSRIDDKNKEFTVFDGRYSTFKGYTISPTIGFEYFPLKNISIGADAALKYTTTKSQYSYTSSNTDYRSKHTEFQTDTAITVKYYLK